MHEVSVPRPVPPKPSRPLIAVVMAAAVIAVTGCRTASWKPPSSWSMFGSSSKATGGLTDAPEYAQGPAKPSATASPYPTTSTPEAYEVGDGGTAARGAGLAAASPSPSPSTVAPGGSVVYGSTPPAAPAALSQERFASLPSGSVASPPTGAYGAQVGPYAPATQADPAAASSGYAAAAYGGGPPSSVGEDRFGAVVDPLPGGRGGADATPNRFDPGPAGDPASQLVSDRTPAGSDVPVATPAAPAAGGWQSPPTAAAAPTEFPDPGQDSRYSAGGSRFSGFGGGAPPPDRVDAMVPQQSLPAFATGSAMPPPAASPGPAPPATFPAITAPAMPPAGPPAATPPFGSPPSRRPDPGYRPGGTSSFQPRSGGAAGVQTVGFDAPLAY
jgi:hypothetical protein